MYLKKCFFLVDAMVASIQFFQSTGRLKIGRSDIEYPGALRKPDMSKIWSNLGYSDSEVPGT